MLCWKFVSWLMVLQCSFSVGCLWSYENYTACSPDFPYRFVSWYYLLLSPTQGIFWREHEAAPHLLYGQKRAPETIWYLYEYNTTRRNWGRYSRRENQPPNPIIKGGQYIQNNSDVPRGEIDDVMAAWGSEAHHGLLYGRLARGALCTICR